MNELSNVVLPVNINKAHEELSQIPSIQQLSLAPSWQKQYTLKQMKQIARRANIHSSWQSVRTKQDMISCLQGRLNEHTEFLQSIHSFTFEEYIAAGKQEIESTKYTLRNQRKYKYTYGLSMGVEQAMDASVHMIPSGSGVHLGHGFILTCSHCVAHDDYMEEEEDGSKDNDSGVVLVDSEENKLGRAVELVNARGQIFGSVCVHVCNDTDLALLQIFHDDLERINLGSLPLGTIGSDVNGTEIFALGNPCDTDLETDGKSKNGFNPFHVSEGMLVKKLSKERADRYGLGRLIHSAWTYWGHSGCPLITVGRDDDGDNDGGYDTGEVKVQVVGIHNSWDDRNGNRHGVPLDDIWNFVASSTS